MNGGVGGISVTKSIKSILFVLIAAVLTCLAIVICSSQARAESVDSDIILSIDSAIAMSLTNCDASDSSTISINVQPTPAGTFKSNCQTATINTNAPGYTLTAKATGSNTNYNSGSITNNLLYLNPTTITPTPTINSTANLITSPAVLGNDTWGFAVEDRLNFDSTYTIDNASNKYANLPTSDTTIYSTTTFPLPETEHTFYYGVDLTTDTMAGTYATTVTYTGIAEAPAPVPCLSDDTICIKVTEPGTIAVQNKWTSPITYSMNGSDPITIAGSALSSDINVTTGDVIEVAESAEDETFRLWSGANQAFVAGVAPSDTARASITKMPHMDHFTIDAAGTTAGDYFFNFFNHTGVLVSLPAGSFDISNVTATGNYFFSGFNQHGTLTSLPAGSFDTSNITSAEESFFSSFNYDGTLASLPDGSFNTSNITSAANDFFHFFNQYGALTSLPADSFNTSNITSAADYFFANFNQYGALTSLPADSFDISNITSVGYFFFSYFNNVGALTSLPDGSFNISNITSAADTFFSGFNNAGALTSLPAGSFDISNITSAEGSFFNSFNGFGALTSLPAGSFDTSNITVVGRYFFSGFNNAGALTSLPDGSFNTSNITSAGNYFFTNFNSSGRLQAGIGITITNKSSSSIIFSQKPEGSPDGTSMDTSVPAGGTITFLSE